MELEGGAEGQCLLCIVPRIAASLFLPLSLCPLRMQVSFDWEAGLLVSRICYFVARFNRNRQISHRCHVNEPLSRSNSEWILLREMRIEWTAIEVFIVRDIDIGRNRGIKMSNGDKKKCTEFYKIALNFVLHIFYHIASFDLSNSAIKELWIVLN